MASAEERIKLERTLRSAEEVLRKEYLCRALSTIAYDYYTDLFSDQHLLVNWVNRTETESDLTMIAFFLEYTGLKLFETAFEEESKEILSYAAQVFEYVARYMVKKITAEKEVVSSRLIKLLQHSAICYDCAGYPSNSVVMANLALEESKSYPNNTTKTDPFETFVFECNRIMIQFLARGFNLVDVSIERLLQSGESVINITTLRI